MKILRIKFGLLCLLIFLSGCATGPRPVGPPVITSYSEGIKGLKSSDPDERCEALMYLGASRDARAIAPITKLLSDTNLLVRLTAVQALRNYSSPLTIESLRIALADPDRDVRYAAALALFELEDYSGEDVLVEGLSSPRPEFREYALLALGKMRSRKAIPEIIKLLRDPKTRTRCDAAYVLGLFQATAAVDALLEAMEDPEKWVRKDSWEALKAITGRDFEFHYDGPEALRAAELVVWRQWREKGKTTVPEEL